MMMTFRFFNKTIIIAFIALLGAFDAAVAYAYCYEPSPPQYEPTKPITPWCVNETAKTHTCDDWIINNYISDMKNYRGEVSQYVDKLNAYIEEAVEYAQCKIDNLQ